MIYNYEENLMVGKIEKDYLPRGYVQLIGINIEELFEACCDIGNHDEDLDLVTVDDFSMLRDIFKGEVIYRIVYDNINAYSDFLYIPVGEIEKGYVVIDKINEILEEASNV